MPSPKTYVLNAFRPDSEMDDPDLFTGRESQVLTLTESLMSVGSCPMVLGDRGLGKSSLAQQVRLIAMGGTELLTRYGHADSAIPMADSFIALYVGCSDGIRTTTDLLRRLTDGVMSVFARDRSDPRNVELVDRTSRTSLSLKVFSHERAKKWVPGTWTPRRMDSVADYEQALIDATTRLSDIYETRVLLVIDELDRLRDKTGLASFIKVATSPTLKFMLVGIAQNVGDLLSDHESIERVVAPTTVEQMTQRELEGIIDRAMHRLRVNGVNMRFNPEATQSLARIASGFPWFVHVIGQSALTIAFSEPSAEVTPAHLGNAVTGLTTNRFAQQFWDRYQKAVKESMPREITLRVLAKWNGRDIPTSEVYPLIKSLGVKNPSEYRRQLCAEPMGILNTAPYRPTGVVRFRNEMFKIYVRLQTSVFEGVDELVDAAWREYR